LIEEEFLGHHRVKESYIAGALGLTLPAWGLPVLSILWIAANNLEETFKDRKSLYKEIKTIVCLTVNVV